MKAKKVLSVALTASMAAALLAGCGSSAPAETAASEAPAAEATEAPAEEATEAPAEEASEAPAEEASGETVNINIYRAAYNVAEPDQGEEQAIQDAINAYIEPKIGVTVTINDINNAEYADKANLALANAEVDLLWTANWWSTIGTDLLIQNNAAYDITDILHSDDGKTLYESMPEWYWTAAQYNGKDYFIPVYKEGAEGYEMKVLKSQADSLGIDVDQLTSDVAAAADPTAKLKAFEPALQAAADAGVKYPYVVAGTQMFYRYYIDKYDFIDQPMMSLLAVDHDANEVVNPVATQDFADFCKMMGDWGTKGYMNVDDEIGGVVTASTTQSQDWLLNWWTAVPNDKESWGRDGNQEEYFVPISKNWGSSHTTLGSCFAVNSACDEAKATACIKFLGLLFTDPTVGNLYTYGIEGTDYHIDENGYVDRTGDGEGTLFNHSPWESTSVKAVTLEAGEPEDKVALYDTFNNSAESSPANGFRFDHSSVDAQYTACLNLLNEMGKPLELGAYVGDDVDAQIAAYQEALDAAGYQDVLKAAQDQYNEWKNN